MIKKSVSFLLSLLLAVTACGAALIVSSAAEPLNYLQNGGFEEELTIINHIQSDLSANRGKWGRYSSTVTRMDPIGASDFDSYDSAARNGTGYLKSGVTVSGNYVRGFGQPVALTPGDYFLTFIAKSQSDTLFSAGVYTSDASTTSDTDKALVRNDLSKSNDWKTYILEFTVTEDAIYSVIFGGNTDDQTGGETFCLDNVAIYAKSDICRLSVNASVGGTVTGGGLVGKGTSVTLTATAKSGYEFSSWTDGETNPVRQVTLNSDEKSYTASFTKITADLIANGDFEADDWAIGDFWTPISTNAAFVAQTADGNTYAKATGGTTCSMGLSGVTLKAGHTYVLRFDSLIPDTVSGNGTNFYRAGFYKSGTTALTQGNALGSSSYASVYNASQVGIWKTVTVTYTPDSDTVSDVILGFYNNECTSDWYIDNITLYDTADLHTVSAAADMGGSAEGSAVGVLTGTGVTFTAVAASGYVFDGWYDSSDQKISNQAVFSFRVTGDVTYTARFVSETGELVVDGGFELAGSISDENLTETGRMGVWGRVNTGVKRMDRITAESFVDGVDSAEVNGTAYLQSGGTADGNYLRSWGQNVTLEANTDYKLTFIAKSNVTGTNVYAGVVKPGQHASINGKVAEGSVTLLTASAEWKLYTLTFNSGENTAAVVAFGSNYSLDAQYIYAVDNVSLVKDVPEYGDPITNGGFESGTAEGWRVSDGAALSVVSGQSWIVAQYLGTYAATLSGEAGAAVTSPAFAVESGETYELVFYSRHGGTTGQTVNVKIAGANADNFTLSSYDYLANADQKGQRHTVTEGEAAGTYSTHTLQKYIVSFTAGDTGSATVTLSLPNGGAVNIDSFSYYKRSDIGNYVANKISFTGTAIRTSGTQGLRFKSEISLEALVDLQCSAKVVEYGTLAIRNEFLNGEALVYGGSYTQQGGTVKEAKTGVAYQLSSGKNVLFAQTAYKNTFTGVLIGIKEENYQKDYTTRVYAKIRFADGTETVVYGAQQTASVYNVAKYIVDNNLETEQTRAYLTEHILNLFH